MTGGYIFMKKRSIALVMAGLMTAVSLAGCAGNSSSDTADAGGAKTEAAGSGTETGGQKSLTVAWWGNQVRNERTQAALDKYSELNPGVTLDGQFSEWGDYWNKLATASAGNSLPDVIQMDYAYLDQYAQNNLLLDLTPYLENGTLNLDDANQDVLNSGKVNGKLYAVPIGINAPSLLYNKAVTDAAGVTIKDNMTLDEFIQACRIIKEKTGYRTNMAYGVTQEIVQYMIRANGHSMYGEGRLNVESADEFVPMFKVFEDGVKEGWHVDPSIYAEITPGSVEQDPFVYGASEDSRSWCVFCWSNQIGAYENCKPEDMPEIGITTWPSADPAKSDFLKPAQFFSVSANTANPEEAVKIIDYWTNSMDANNILLAERGVPLSEKVADELSPSLEPAIQGSIQFINEVVSPASSQIDPPMPNGSSEVTELLLQLEEKVAYGQMTSEEAAQELFTKGNEIMSSK
jgi:multiple sugar transport system substrate-binding protein